MNEQEQVLNEMIKNFYADKQEADYFKKMAEDFNSAIKELLQKLEKTEFETDNGLVAKIVTQHRENFIEESLMLKLKELGVTKPIKTIEVVDYDILEDAIYNGELNAAELSDCKQVKDIVTLKVSEKKGK